MKSGDTNNSDCFSLTGQPNEDCVSALGALLAVWFGAGKVPEQQRWVVMDALGVPANQPDSRRQWITVSTTGAPVLTTESQISSLCRQFRGRPTLPLGFPPPDAAALPQGHCSSKKRNCFFTAGSLIGAETKCLCTRLVMHHLSVTKASMAPNKKIPAAHTKQKAPRIYALPGANRGKVNTGLSRS